VLLVAVISGLGIAALYRWAAAWSSVTLAPYLRSVADLQPDLRHLEAMPYLVKLHLFSASALIAMVPFTMPMRVFLATARHAADRALAPASDVFRRKRQQWQDWSRQSGGNLIWSEEDD
jgi:nitrate reductase gamma subunit